ncbi:MAG: hypothetical protein JRI68_23235 [Deltaproteobacteria bacterium]|nr:hypothetical protein [Deltaproteobacteria bacterium]
MARRPAPRGRHATVCHLVALTGALAAAFAGCALARSGGLEQNCTADTECADETPCTEDGCSPDGFCQFLPVDAYASLVQVPFDCKELRCEQGQEVVVPVDDKPTNPCVDAVCTDGELSTTDLPDGEECSMGEGTGSCQGGECVVQCGDDPAVCDDGNPCTLDNCDQATKVCVHEDLGNEPMENQILGDCLLELCQAGQPQQVADDTDLPVDGKPCTDDLCNGGVVDNPPLPVGTPCGNQAFCDEAGNCVGCNEPSDCDGEDTACRWRTCENQICGVDYAPPGTVVQAAGPCQQQQCDGQGNIETANLLNGTSCDDSAYCNGADTCIGGNCSHAGDPCPGADNDGDCSESCDEGGDHCLADDAPGSPCASSAGACDGIGNCIQCGVDPPPTGSVSNCPPVCTGGCTAPGICHINCLAKQECKNTTVNCPPGYACHLNCAGSTQGCEGIALHCPMDFPCAIDCSGIEDQACKNADFYCSSNGTCGIACGAGQMCQGTSLHCGGDACTATCASNGDDPSMVSCQSSCLCTPC